MTSTGFPMRFFLGNGRPALGDSGETPAGAPPHHFRRWRELPTNAPAPERPLEVNLGRHPFDRARSRLLDRAELMHVLFNPHLWLEEEHNDREGAVLRGLPPEDGIWFPGVMDLNRPMALTQVFTYDHSPTASPEAQEDGDFLVEVVRRRPIIFYRALPAGHRAGRTTFPAARQLFRAALRESLDAHPAAVETFLPAADVARLAEEKRTLADHLLNSRGAEWDVLETEELPGIGAEPMDVLIRTTGKDRDGNTVGYASCHFHISEKPLELGEAAFSIASDLPGFLELLNRRSREGRLDVLAFQAEAPDEALNLSKEEPLRFVLPTLTVPATGERVPDLRGARFLMQTTPGTFPASFSCLILQGPIMLQRQQDGSTKAFINDVEVAWQADWQNP